MRKLKSILLLLTGALIAPLAVAQTATSPFTAPEYYASAFNLWSVNSQQPNTYIFQGRSICNSAAQGVNFFDFATNAPVFINDSNNANDERVTPSAITNTAGSCGVTISPSHTHNTFQMQSGTAGLQEAINTLKDQSAWPVVIVLDRNWYVNANQLPGTNANSIIGAATGDYTVLIKDITTSPVTFYAWSGSAYQSTNNTVKNTAPTLAAGAAAGTGPTVANTGGSTAIVGQANVTAGTSTTTGTLFTETWPTVANGGPQYAGSCTVSSVGTNLFTAFTVATSFASSQRTLTVTATSAPTASTAYQFAYNCK